MEGFKVEMPLERMFEIFFGEKLFNLEKQTIMKETDYMSLFDYLGRAGGDKLGKQVFKFAKKNGIKPISKQVSTTAYTGKILCYPPSFLHTYFIARNKWKEIQDEQDLNKVYFE